MDESTSLRMFLDLGDVFTKALAVGDGEPRRLRFPSVVAHQLLDGGARATDLLLDDREELFRPEGFAEGQYRRDRSYPGAAPLVAAARPVPRTRFAGWIAAAYGADRRLLGLHPTDDNVDALVHKALLAGPADGAAVTLTFVVDHGPKADAIQRFVGATPRTVRFLRWTVGQAEPAKLELELVARLVDAADCARAAIAAGGALPTDRALLVLDVGYLRTKAAIVSPEGCERQEELTGLGVASVVRRILRDGQDQGLVEDELAVIRALETSRETIEVQGRRFEVGRPLADARRSLAEELERAALALAADHFARRGEPCGGLAVLGGGAHLVGQALVGRLAGAEHGLPAVWVADDPHLLVAAAAGMRDARP